MLLLLAFALLAGAGTALSPCVLPVLPALLSAGGAGGRRRPLGVVLGLAVTFTITIVGVAELVGGVGLGTDPLRVLAVVVLAGFGLALLLPGVAARLEAPLARLSRFGPRSRGDGFASGLVVGAALGLVYTPCAGPILAAVITVSAATGRSIAVAVAYATGSAGVLLAPRVRGPGGPPRGPGGRRGAAGPPGARGSHPPPPPGDVPGRRPGGGARAGGPACARGDHAPHRAGDRHERRRELRPARRARDPAGEHHGVARALGRRRAPAAHAARPRAALRDPGARRHPGRRGGSAKARSRAGVRRHAALVQHPRRATRDAARAARPGRARRLLDLHLHQLPADAAVPRGMGPPLPEGRLDDRRRPHARVRLRARRLQRAARDRPARHPLPGGAGQRERHVERVREHVLARRVPHRCDRRGAIRERR